MFFAIFVFGCPGGCIWMPRRAWAVDLIVPGSHFSKKTMVANDLDYTAFLDYFPIQG